MNPDPYQINTDPKHWPPSIKYCVLQVRIRQQETGQEVGVSILPSLEGGGPEARGLLSAIAYDIAGGRSGMSSEYWTN